MKDEINILPSHKIDKTKWDDCVARNENGLIYARSFYLDAIAYNWSGIVLNDYDAVMPLVWKKKLGIKYFCGTPFIQQLGVVGAIIPEKILLKKIRSYARYGDIPFNYKNTYRFLNRIRTNQFVTLDRNYQEIYNDYKDSLKRNIRKAVRNNLSIADGTVEDIRLLLIDESNQLDNYYKNDRIPALLNFASYMNISTYCFIKKVIDESGIVLSTSLFLKDNKRIYNLFLINTAQGRRQSSMPFLIDKVLQEYSNSKLIFDFEGSDTPSIKKFNAKFSASEEKYYIYSMRFPFNNKY